METVGRITVFGRGPNRDCGSVRAENGETYGFNLGNVDDTLRRALTSDEVIVDALGEVEFTPYSYVNRFNVEKRIADQMHFAKTEGEQACDTEPVVEGSGTIKKEFLSTNEQLSHMASQGICLDVPDNIDIAQYLEQRNNYYRLRAFRTGFKRVEVDGKRRFVNLNLSTLIDLAELDSLTREIFLYLTLDIEHAAKLALLKKAEGEEGDPYSLVNDFLDAELSKKAEAEAKGEHYSCIEINKLEQSRQRDPYVGGLVERFSGTGYPLWAFLELISFGNLNYLYLFAAQRYEDKRMVDNFYLMQIVRILRNACAHGNCLINDLGIIRDRQKINYRVLSMLRSLENTDVNGVLQLMNSPKIHHLITTLYTHSDLCDEECRGARTEALYNLSCKLDKSRADFERGQNYQLVRFADLYQNVLKSLYPIEDYCCKESKSGYN